MRGYYTQTKNKVKDYRQMKKKGRKPKNLDKTEPYYDFASRLRTLMTKFRIKNQRQLSIRTRIHPASISDWSRGVKFPTEQEQWLKLKSVFGPEIYFLMFGEDLHMTRQITPIVSIPKQEVTLKVTIESVEIYTEKEDKKNEKPNF
jgi:hypothetical protein